VRAEKKSDGKWSQRVIGGKREERGRGCTTIFKDVSKRAFGGSTKERSIRNKPREEKSLELMQTP